MKQETFATVGSEETTVSTATLEDFIFEELEDRLELASCIICSEELGVCIEGMC